MKLHPWAAACTVISILLLHGCGGGGSSGSSDDVTEIVPPPATAAESIQGIAQLGILTQATVEIFKVTDAINARFEKLYTETTSDGDMDSAGRFNTHSAELEDERFYVYQVSGGTDIDADDNGTSDEVPVVNHGVLRAVVKGAWLKAMSSDMFRITAVSEHLYQKCYNEIAYTPYRRTLGIEHWATWESNNTLGTDLNGDGVIDGRDVAVFDPVSDREHLRTPIQNKYSLIVDDIHNRKDSYSVNLRNVLSAISPLQQVDYLSNMPEAYEAVVSRDDKTLYKVGEDYFSVIDVSDPKALRYIGVVADEGGRNLALSHDEKTAYSASYRGLSVIDLSDRSAPRVVTTYPVDLAGEIVVSDDDRTLYISDDRYGVKLFDVTDRTAPQPIGSYRFDDPANNARVISLALSADNTLLYVTNTTKGLAVLDVSDPANPTEIAVMAMTYPGKVVLSPDNRVAYVADDVSGIKAVDIRTRGRCGCSQRLPSVRKRMPEVSRSPMTVKSFSRPVPVRE